MNRRELVTLLGGAAAWPLTAALGNNLPARAAKTATSRIPIVFTMGADPVQNGLSRPDGNITGVTVLAADQIQKRLQLLHDVPPLRAWRHLGAYQLCCHRRQSIILTVSPVSLNGYVLAFDEASVLQSLHEAVPMAKVFGFIVNPDNFGRTSSGGRTPIELAQEAVTSWGGTIEVAQARTVGDFDAARTRADRQIPPRRSRCPHLKQRPGHSGETVRERWTLFLSVGEEVAEAGVGAGAIPARGRFSLQSIRWYGDTHVRSTSAPAYGSRPCGPRPTRSQATMQENPETQAQDR
jgi:hypothetical protein